MNEEQKKKGMEARQKSVEKANRTKKSTYLHGKDFIDVVNTPFLMVNKDILNMTEDEAQEKGNYSM